MYREHLALLKRLHLLADLVVIGLAFYAVRLLAEFGIVIPWLDGRVIRVPLADEFLWLAPAAAFVWLFFMDANGLYYTYRTVRDVDLAAGIAKSLLQGTVALVTVFYFIGVDVSRILLAGFVVFTFVFLTTERLLIHRALGRIRQRGGDASAILFIGTGRAAQDLAAAFRRNPHWGLRPFGFLRVDASETEPTEIEGAPVLGGIEEFERVLSATPIDEVAIAQPELSADRLGRLIALCEGEGIKARVIADLYRPAAARQVVEELDGLPVVTFAIGPGVGWQLLMKEAFDRIGALVLLVLLSPLFALVALAVAAERQGSVLFVQERTGLRKRKFQLYKFRTMIPDAEALLTELEDMNEGPGPTFKMTDDPRVTPVGRWLRRLSLDELPQLWNVLRGEMSFVGPRPPLPMEVAQYEGWQRRRLSMKPGISGLWQVAGRGRPLDFSEWVRLDLEYIDNWSLALDLRILLMTVPTVLFGRGAV